MTKSVASDSKLEIELLHPMGVEAGKFLYIVNYGSNSICKLEVKQSNKKKPRRRVSAFAVEAGQWALSTVI